MFLKGQKLSQFLRDIIFQEESFLFPITKNVKGIQGNIYFGIQISLSINKITSFVTIQVLVNEKKVFLY